MQASITKLEQTSDQLHLSAYSSTTNKTALEEIKREVESLKGLYLSRSQFPSIPQVTPKIPLWQLEAAEVHIYKSQGIYSIKIVHLSFLSILEVKSSRIAT